MIVDLYGMCCVGIIHWDTSQGRRLEIFPVFLGKLDFVLINSQNCFYLSNIFFSIYMKLLYKRSQSPSTGTMAKELKTKKE